MVRFSRVLGLVVFACVGVGIEASRQRRYLISFIAFLVAFIFVWDFFRR